MMDNKRTKVLAKAIDLINGERQADYGTPQENFACIAKMWSAYLGHDIGPRDTANMMALLKLARLRNGHHDDSSVDAAGYCALAAELTDW